MVPKTRPAPDQPAQAAAPPARHPLVHAGQFLLADLLSTLAFVGFYAATHSIYLATGLGIALGLGQIAYEKYRAAPIDAMQWLSLFLVVVFGGATLLTRNPLFVMLKPTLIYAAIGAVMLKPGWMNRYLPPIAQTLGSDIAFVFGYIWAGMMFATALANLGFALLASASLWAWFLGIFPLASKIVLILFQYGVTRFMIRRRLRASGTTGVLASA